MPKNKTSFKPGVSGNPKGKPKGAKNRSTTEIRNHIQSVLDGQYEKLQSDLDSMNPFQRVMMVEKLTKFFLPALSKADGEIEHTGEIKISVSYSDSIGLENNPQSLDQGEDYTDYDALEG